MDSFILSGYPHVAEGDLFARHVLPRLDHAPLFPRLGRSARLCARQGDVLRLRGAFSANSTEYAPRNGKGRPWPGAARGQAVT
jgi:hypothetical protein